MGEQQCHRAKRFARTLFAQVVFDIDGITAAP
jgi:hypothetical protein